MTEQKRFAVGMECFLRYPGHESMRAGFAAGIQALIQKLVPALVYGGTLSSGLDKALQNDAFANWIANQAPASLNLYPDTTASPAKAIASRYDLLCYRAGCIAGIRAVLDVVRTIESNANMTQMLPGLPNQDEPGSQTGGMYANRA